MGLFSWLNSEASSAGKTSITAGELLQEMKEGKKPYVVDVREPGELSALPALPGAKNVPLSVLPQRFGEIPKDKQVSLVCRSGHRSGQAMVFLKKQGYANLRNVDGGMMAVQAAKKP